MDDDHPHPVHEMCDCDVPDLDSRIYSACSRAVSLMQFLFNTHDLCAYNMAIVLAAQRVHLRESTGMTEQETNLVLKRAENTAELMYAYSMKQNDPEGTEERRRSMC